MGGLSELGREKGKVRRNRMNCPMMNMGLFGRDLALQWRFLFLFCGLAGYGVLVSSVKRLDV